MGILTPKKPKSKYTPVVTDNLRNHYETKKRMALQAKEQNSKKIKNPSKYREQQKDTLQSVESYHPSTNRELPKSSKSSIDYKLIFALIMCFISFILVLVFL